MSRLSPARPASPACSAGRSIIRARRGCTATGCSNSRSTAPTSRSRHTPKGWGRGAARVHTPFSPHPNRLEQGIRALPSLGFRGGNITLPHKERAVGFVDVLTPTAKRIGAINTLIVRDDGSILGDNSDGFGFIANLQQFQPAWRGDAGPAVLLG